MHRIVAGHVAGGGIDLDQHRVFGKGRGVGVPGFLEELAPHQQNGIGVPGHGAQAGLVVGAAVPIEGMAGGKVHPGGQGLVVDVGTQGFRQGHQGFHRAAAGHLVPTKDQRTFGVQQQLRRLLQSGRVGGRAGEDMGRGQMAVFGVLLHHIDGQGDEHGAAGGFPGHLEGPVEQMRQFVRVVGLHAPLGEGGRHGHQIVAEQGFAQAHPVVLLTRREHQGRPSLPGVVEGAQGVPQPGAHVHVGEAHLPGQLGVGVGHGHRHRLVQREDVFDVRIIQQAVQQRTFSGARVAENVLHALRPQCFHQDLFSLVGLRHVVINPRWWFTTVPFNFLNFLI